MVNQVLTVIQLLMTCYTVIKSEYSLSKKLIERDYFDKKCIVFLIFLGGWVCGRGVVR